MIDDNDLTFGDWSRFFAVSGLTSGVVINSLAATAGGGRAVIVRHLVGSGNDDLAFV